MIPKINFNRLQTIEKLIGSDSQAYKIDYDVTYQPFAKLNLTRKERDLKRKRLNYRPQLNEKRAQKIRIKVNLDFTHHGGYNDTGSVNI